MRHQFYERLVCPACNEAAADEIFNSRFDQSPIANYISEFYGSSRVNEMKGWVYRLDRCQQCKLVFQRYVGDDSFLSELYGNWLSSECNQAEAYASFRNLLETPAATRDGHELMWVANFLRMPLDGMRTLDYGMGWALWPRIAKELGCDSYGFDLSTTRMEAAAAHGIGIVEDANLPAGAFDFINTEQVFEHVSDPLTVATRLSAALRPGGILKISVPNGTDILHRLKVGNWSAKKGSRQSLNAVAPLEHINCFNKTALIMLGTKANLIPVPESIFSQFAFLAHKRSINFRAPKETLKAFIRPWYRFHNRQSLYVWLRRAA